MVIVDRIEGDLAVVKVDADMFEDIPAADIGSNAHAGAVLREIAPGEYV